MKKIIPGILISALLIYLSVKGTDFQGVMAGMTKVHYGYVWYFLLLMILMQTLRAWRWGMILSPLGRLAGMQLFAVTSVGFLAITALPARLGELFRPYLVARDGAIKISAALGTVFVERFLDGVTILAIASLTIFFTSLPAWLIKANFIFFMINLALLAGIMCAVFRRSRLERFLHVFIRWLPSPWTEKLQQLIGQFLDGFQIVACGARFWRVLLLSALIWLIDALSIYSLFLAFNFSLPPAAAFVVMIILIVGIAIPTAPGFIGNWHYSCVLGLSLFGIAKNEALTFAILFHFLAVSLTVVLGLAFLPYLNFSFANLWQETKRQLTIS